MRLAGRRLPGRVATRLAGWACPPSLGRMPLARMNRRGYVSPSATIWHPQLQLGAHVFIGDHVTILQRNGGGPVVLEDEAHLYDGTFIQTGNGGSVTIGAGTHVQPRCYFSAFLAPVRIGRSAEVAASCAFFPHNHGTRAGRMVRDLPLSTKGGITVGDGAWLGFGVIVLDGVHIGAGAVVGAGSVVTRDVPPDTIAAGSPARVLKHRQPPAADQALPPEAGHCSPTDNR